MAISLIKYLEIKDKYCINYLGTEKDIKEKLLKIKTILEECTDLEIILSFDVEKTDCYFYTIKNREDWEKLVAESYIL